MKKKYLTISLIALLSISLGACGSSDTEQKEPVQQTEEIKEEKVEKEEVKNELKDNDLFNEVYYKIASKDIAHGKDAIFEYVEANNFTIIDENLEIDSYRITDDETADEDYIYIVFEDEPDLELVSSISYYLAEKELEVGYYNYSTNKEAQYDSLKIHKIGGPEEKVESLEEQITFLKEAKNEHKVNKDKVKEKALENEKETPIELVIDVKEVIEDGKVSFNINTNLPDNTTGTVALENKSIDYIGQDGFEVKNGKAEAGSYSMQGEPFPSGTYKVSVSTPVSQIQSDDVIIEIGEDYSNYIGEQFNDSDLGRSISYSFEINIP